MCYLQHMISTWGQSEKYVAAWTHHIRTKRIQASGRPLFLTLHHPPTLEDSTFLTKKYCYLKNCTQLDYLPSNLLHNIGIWHMGLVHCNKMVIAADAASCD